MVCSYIIFFINDIYIINMDNKMYKNMNRNKKRINLSESDLHNIIKKSVNRVLKESIDSVNIDQYGSDAENYHSPTDDEIRNSTDFDRKYRPWRDNPECRTLEGLISWGYNQRRRFDNGTYSIDHFLCDLYYMVD